MQGFGADGGRVPWAERAGGDQIDGPAESGLEVLSERDDFESDLGIDIDEDVDIASVGLLAARENRRLPTGGGLVPLWRAATPPSGSQGAVFRGQVEMPRTV
jgi:hypothetical protein